MFENMAKIMKYHRKKSGLSRKELADLAGVGKTVIFDIEHGKDTVRFSTLAKVCNVLGIKINLESKLIKAYYQEKNAKS